MKNKFLLSSILLLFFFNSSFSQNLVPNWSFEDTVMCPTGVNQIDNATGWSRYRGTPDYFNSCNNGSVGVPSNIYDYQNAKTGNAYAGLAPFNTSGGNIRECIGIQLNQQLTIGQKYFVSFYVSRAVNNTYAINVASNKMGARFSTISYSASNVPIDNYAQVFSDSIIEDTLNWIPIRGSFIADSTYNFISIGNFFKDTATSYVRFDSSGAISYYFIDDIKVSTDSNFVYGIDELFPSTFIKIFPNPARDWIVVEGRDISKLTLYNGLGQLCISEEVSSSSLVKINISSFSKGIYFLNVKTSKENIIQKIINE